MPNKISIYHLRSHCWPRYSNHHTALPSSYATLPQCLCWSLANLLVAPNNFLLQSICFHFYLCLKNHLLFLWIISIRITFGFCLNVFLRKSLLVSQIRLYFPALHSYCEFFLHNSFMEIVKFIFM